jgi:hypothetical protein
MKTDRANIPKSRVHAGIYLRGESLDAGKVTEILKMTPSIAQQKGVPRATKNPKCEYVAQIGVWAIVTESDSRTIGDHIQELFRSVKFSADDIRGISGVDEAYLDLFIAKDAGSGDSDDVEFELSGEQLSSLSRLNLPVHFTVSRIKSCDGG